MWSRWFFESWVDAPLDGKMYGPRVGTDKQKMLLTHKERDASEMKQRGHRGGLHVLDGVTGSLQNMKPILGPLSSLRRPRALWSRTPWPFPRRLCHMTSTSMSCDS